MSRKDAKKVKHSTNADSNFGFSAFASLSSDGLNECMFEDATLEKMPTLRIALEKEVKIGCGRRLEIRREKSGRGGKTVTTVKGFPEEFGQDLKNKILKQIKSSIGTGGNWVNNTMELQGDKREEVFKWMVSLGYRPVKAGG